MSGKLRAGVHGNSPVGWKVPWGIQFYEKLPQNARSYIEGLSGMLGVPFLMISTGPERKHTICQGEFVLKPGLEENHPPACLREKNQKQVTVDLTEIPSNCCAGRLPDVADPPHPSAQPQALQALLCPRRGGAPLPAAADPGAARRIGFGNRPAPQTRSFRGRRLVL